MSIPGAVTLASALLCMFAGTFSLMLARAPRWPEQRWFAFTAFAAALFITFIFPTTCGGFSMGARFAFGAVAMCGANLNVVGWVVLSRVQLRQKIEKGDRVLIGLLIALIPSMAVPDLAIRFALLPVHVGWLQADYRLLQPTALGSAIYALDCFGILLALYRYSRGIGMLGGAARWNVLGLAVFMIAAANDAMVGSGLYVGPQLLALAYLWPITTVAMTQAERLVRSARDLDDLSARLEREMAARSQALLDTRRLLDRSERLAAIGQLAAGVAHEVNNPAAAVKGNLSYLKLSLDKGTMPADARLCIEESLDSVERIARIVRELCDSARAAGGAIEAQPVDLLAAIRSAQVALRTPLANAKIELDIPAGLSVRASEGHLVQVLTNLLNNAVQAAKKDEPPQLQIRARNEDERISITVEDRGGGMAPETLKRLFEPFFTTKPIGQGTGLGLAVSRGLVHAMGGALSFESQLGKGTTARIELNAAAPVPPTPKRATGNSSPRLEIPRRLLLIDDDAEVRASLSRMLSLQYDVDTAGSVQEGLVKSLSMPRPDVIVCELLLDDGGGHQLYNLLAASHPELARRLIFLLGPAPTADAAAFIANQAQPVLNKPLDLAALREAVLTLEPQRREKVA